MNGKEDQKFVSVSTITAQWIIKLGLKRKIFKYCKEEKSVTLRICENTALTLNNSDSNKVNRRMRFDFKKK